MRHLLYWLLNRSNRETRAYRRALRRISNYDPDNIDSSASGMLKQWAGDALAYRGRIFGGPYSQDMWEAINGAKSRRDLREALYFVCCRIQELESKLSRD